MDVELTHEAFRQVLRYVNIHVAPNGEKALSYFGGLKKLNSIDTRKLPDLILLDLKLPGIDGFEVLRQLKTTPLLKRLPIIILTSSSDEGDRARAYDLGANVIWSSRSHFLGFWK